MRNGTQAELVSAMRALRARTLAFFEGQDEASLRVPHWEIINPPLWELGHVGWFQEHWCLRWPHRPDEGPRAQARLGESLLPDADALYNSSRVAHARRWSLPLPTLAATRSYLAEVMARSIEALARGGDDDDALYFARLSFFHECMHLEAFTYTWQTLGRALPEGVLADPAHAPTGTRWLDLPAGEIAIGHQGPGFAHDNEQPPAWRAVAATRIASAPVTQGEYLAFVQSGGYRDGRWWAPEVFERLRAEDRVAPRYWERVAGADAGAEAFQRRRFGRLEPLDTGAAVVHVDAHEAQAYCRWAGVRLPTEAQWVSAARTLTDFTWGGQVWEWTDSEFGPLPGFSPGPYEDYSQPWFEGHRVVRGGSFATPRWMVDPVFRNFYRPHRGDPFLGFRVCR